MLWFNDLNIILKNLIFIFQYILCYGSTFLENRISGIPLPFQYILCYGSTIFVTSLTRLSILFQYILCYGSTIAGM